VDTASTYDGKVAETYDMRYMIHAIHGVDQRQNPLVIYRTRGVFAFASPDDVKPTGWPADGQTIYGSDNNSKIGHTWTVVHYPKPPSECLACHNAEAFEAPDQTKAVALTVDPGTNYLSQSDDIVIGPTAAACTACHATAAVRSHATQFGYRTNVTKDEMLLLAQP
jgi:OmcA/MtrC family decaheme c-type cytochrome